MGVEEERKVFSQEKKERASSVLDLRGDWLRHGAPQKAIKNSPTPLRHEAKKSPTWKEQLSSDYVCK